MRNASQGKTLSPIEFDMLDGLFIYEPQSKIDERKLWEEWYKEIGCWPLNEISTEVQF